MGEPITKELRELADKIDESAGYGVVMPNLNAIADRIDAEHERRMENCRRVGKRLIIRYMRGVLNDYDRNIKRVRKGDATEVVRCEDCMYAQQRMDDRFVCTLRPLGARVVDADDYCSRGVRKEVNDD